MPTTVSTTPVQLNDGTAVIVHIGNTGDPGRPVTLAWGGNTRSLDPGFSADIKPAGSPITAVTSSGSTTLTVDTTGVPPGPGGGGSGGGAVSSVVGLTGAVTGSQIASDAALTGTFGPGSDQWLKSNGAAFAFSFITISTSDSATGLPTAATIRWPDGTNGAFTGTTTADGYTGFTATWVGSTTRTLTASGISYDSNGVPVGPTALAVS